MFARLNGIACVIRLPVYPSYLEDDERWLDGTGGADSVRAATLRSADASGLARGSGWCPGSSVGEREGRGMAVTLPAPQPSPGATQDAAHQSAASAADGGTAGNGSNAAAHAISPQQAGAAREQHGPGEGRTLIPGGRRRRQPWRVEVTEEGLLRGCPQPAPSLRIAGLLAAVLDGGHELSEAEMVLLFAARGADFQVKSKRTPTTDAVYSHPVPLTRFPSCVRCSAHPFNAGKRSVPCAGGTAGG